MRGRMSMREFARTKCIPIGTFAKYAHGNPAKRQTLGDGVGHKSLLPKGDVNMIVDMVIRRDRANEGYTRQEIVDVILEMDRSLDVRQAENVWNYIHKTNRHRLTGLIQPQITTTKRSAITLHQQYRWHTLFGDILDRMRTLNTPNFESVSDHFVWNVDEECFMAIGGTDVRIVGERGRKKHEKKGAFQFVEMNGGHCLVLEKSSKETMSNMETLTLYS